MTTNNNGSELDMFEIERMRDDDESRMDFTFSDGSIVSVWWLGAEYQPEDRAERQRYGYSIIGPEVNPGTIERQCGRRHSWQYVGDDIRSGCNAEPNVTDAAETLFSFLGAAAEAYRYSMAGGASENDDLFPGHVMEWAYMNDDVISMVGYELSETSPAVSHEWSI
jgi:hypothetical protein